MGRGVVLGAGKSDCRAKGSFDRFLIVRRIRETGMEKLLVVVVIMGCICT